MPDTTIGSELSDLFRVRLARTEDQLAMDRLWREIDSLHARLQPGFFRVPQGLCRSPHFLRRAIAGPDETLLCAVVPPGRVDELEVSFDRESFLLTDGYLCGLIHLQVFSTPPSAAMVQRRRAHVEDLVVASWARRRGCGRSLMEHGRLWAEQRDASQMVLTVWAGNQGAEAFYRRLGYQPVSTVLGMEL